ncbi:phage tail protein [Bordetella genomosp. 1]|uniref:Phage tail protein n=1 Tax=Bordetella genomosp. 1 TaxID=1395607 RepID=A0A261SIW9_9BORD|nr:phage tail length tape measure family protein [Bordetella genomosp. 1]OZI36283.1 phage tail protein [Bordetella genomosp. 1]
MSNKTVIAEGVVAVSGDASGLTAAMAEVTQETNKAKKSLENLGRGASQNLNKSADQTAQAGKKVERAAQSLVQQIERQIAVAQSGAKGTAEYYQALASQRGVDANLLKPYLDQLNTVTERQKVARAALESTQPVMENLGMSAKALNAATRGLPAQFTDIVVSLQGGQRPMTVLLQQGGQLKDMFGGIGPAARAMGQYVLGLLNPITLVAGGVALVGAAWSKGAGEAQAFNRSLIETGNQAGVTSGRLQEASRRVAEVAGSQAKAAATLTVFAAGARTGAENLERFSSAAVVWERATGTAVEDTAKAFSELAKAPLAATMKLNEGANYVTASLYEQIRALVQQGKASEAATVAQNAYAEALLSRGPQIMQNLSLWEKAWNGVKGAASSAWDAMLDVGRETTPEDRLAAVQKELGEIGTSFFHSTRAARLRAQEVGLRDLIKWQSAAAQAEADRMTQTNRAQFRDEYLSNADRNTKPQQRTLEVEKETQAFRKAVEGLKEGTEEYRRVYAAHQTALAAIDKKFEDKDGNKGPSGVESEVARLRARIAEEKALSVELAQRGLQTSKLNEFERRSAEIGELLSGKLKAQVRANYERTKALLDEAGALVRANAEMQEFQQAREKYLSGLQEGIAKISQEAEAIEDQVSTYGMSKSALEALEIARLRERRAALEGFDGASREIELIEQEIDARTRLSQAIQAKDVKDAQKKVAQEAAQDWARSVDKVGDVFRQGFADMLNDGKNGWKSFTKSLVTTFKTMVADQIYRMFAQPFVATIMANVAGVFGGGGAAGALGGSTSNSALSGGLGLMNYITLARTAYSALTGGITSTLASSISSIGSAIGSSAAQQFALGMTGQGATLASGLAGPTTANSVAAGAGSMFASAIPVAGWIAAGAMVNRSLYKQGWDAGNGTMAPIAKYNMLTGPSLWTDKALRSIGVSGEWASMLSGSSLIARAFGRGPKEYKDTTLVGDFNSLGFNGYTSTPWKQKGGWFRSNKSGTQVGALGDSFLSDVAQAFEEMKANASSLAESIGVSGGKLDGYSETIRVTLTKDQAENERLIQEAIANVGENMVRYLIPNIGDFSKEGEAASATLSRLSASLGSANRALKLLDLKLFDVSVEGAGAAAALVDAFGSIDAMSQATAQYYQLYYTESERAKLSLADMADVLKKVNVTVPNTMDELRSMVSALDLTTQAGRDAYVALLAIAPEFAEIIEATARRGQETAAKLLEAFTGRGGVATALNTVALQALLLKESASGAGVSLGQISRIFLDAASGLLDFASSGGALEGTLSGAQEASLGLVDEIEALRLGIGATIIDFGGLAAALKDVDADVFVAAMGAVFERLADRLHGLLDSIANERIAVRQAAQDILDPAAMSPAAIKREIEGIDTALPSNTALVSAAGALTAADVEAAKKLSERNAAEKAYTSVKDSYDAKQGAVTDAQRRADEATAWLDKLQWDIYAPKTVPYKKKNWAELDEKRSIAQAQLPAAQQAYAQAQAALAAAQAAAAIGPTASEVTRLQEQYAAAVTAAASAQAAATEAANKAREEQTSYADALQDFALDATKSVGKLGELRAETVRYYEAQKALAELLAEGATGLRKSIKDYRYGLLDSDEKFAQMQGEFAQAYAKAMGADGESLAGYAGDLNALLGPMLEAAGGAFSSEAQYQAFVATALARAEAVAGRMGDVAPKDYQKESLDLLGQIDATLAELEKSALTGDQVITSAINASRDATVNGLRQVVNALAGNSVAAFASGGMHSGGLRLVGEQGPELEVTGPSRIFSASQTRSLLAGSEDQARVVEMLRALIQENQALRQEMESLRIEARATASNTAKAVRHLDRIEADGLVVRPDADEPLLVVVHGDGADAVQTEEQTG